MRSARGFSLLEVVVATSLLSSGLLALLTLQAQSLQAQRRVSLLREMVNFAEAELEMRKLDGGGSCTSCHCLAPAPPVPGLSCRVSVESCSAVNIEPCAGANSARASRVAVSVISDRGVEFELSTLRARFPAP